ncbi:hypothetical protein M9Y10_002155 [Tritrichomonas musculus]|uniref:Uncharacterized protein n=1 Tax=Tritrichomonas musculus TaxID=1915356 RepID=A0ABR2L915_9EUKA
MDEDFDSSFHDSDFDWEFNAPHWHDFEKEDDFDNPDSWFDEQQKKNQSIEKAQKEFSQSYNKETHKTRHPTRIPVSKVKGIKSQNSKNKSTTNFSSKFLSESHSSFSKTTIMKDDKSRTIVTSNNSKFYSKLPVRVPLKEKRTNLK